ncbi:hypothetical protein L1987_09565 [Smallanthus sonchifolius]|uniref:Uncharacterized protein n=1 Tax=Smallanthus sonchifolius TaxID=185202 RepID=A0ACB9JNR5_9ASTR|nr:hypothetical protein L1987_09565 [Smallanthus sonchifolius]
MGKNILVFLVAFVLVVGCMGGGDHGYGHGHGHDKVRGHEHGHGDGEGLKMHYYMNRCRSVLVEETVKDIVWSKVDADPTMAAKLLRLHYHDCFVRVTRDAVSFQFQREMWPVFTGRKDGRVSLASEVGGNLPSANVNFTTLLTQFGTKGLNLNDLVTLSGAHTIGISHCTLVSRRLYNFTGKGDADLSLDPAYAQTLRKLCPNPVNPTTILEMDPKSSLTFDSDYYRALNQHKGLFVSDAALLTDRRSALVAKFLENPLVFFAQFARSMVKMGGIEVLLGGEGEVRKNCRVVNGQ